MSNDPLHPEPGPNPTVAAVMYAPATVATATPTPPATPADKAAGSVMEAVDNYWRQVWKSSPAVALSLLALVALGGAVYLLVLANRERREELNAINGQVTAGQNALTVLTKAVAEGNTVFTDSVVAKQKQLDKLDADIAGRADRKANLDKEIAVAGANLVQATARAKEIIDAAGKNAEQVTKLRADNAELTVKVADLEAQMKLAGVVASALGQMGDEKARAAALTILSPNPEVVKGGLAAFARDPAKHDDSTLTTLVLQS